MSATALSRPSAAARPGPAGLTRRLADVAVLTRRNLVHIAREPLQLSDVTVQPVLFTLLFAYVFGAGVSLPHGGSYTGFAIAGLLALNLTTSAMGTAVGLSTDLSSGVIDRFRTLPMWRPAVLVILYPLAFVSNALVPTRHMPAILRAITDWSPVSAVTAAARQLFGNPNPSAAIHAWPMQHPLTASLLWSVGLLVVFAPLATFLYRRRTAD